MRVLILLTVLLALALTAACGDDSSAPPTEEAPAGNTVPTESQQPTEETPAGNTTPPDFGLEEYVEYMCGSDTLPSWMVIDMDPDVDTWGEVLAVYESELAYQRNFEGSLSEGLRKLHELETRNTQLRVNVLLKQDPEEPYDQDEFADEVMGSGAEFDELNSQAQEFYEEHLDLQHQYQRSCSEALTR